MVLQPLIENAVYHGVAQLPQGGTVAVAVHSDEGRIDAIVENPVPEKASGIEGNRIAQLNIRQLLRAHYGDQASFSTTLENGVYRAVLSYPVAEAR
jgi:two-component system sensor histidine kinase AlgZ